MKPLPKECPAGRPYVEPRKEQETPAEMVREMLGLIHGQFYGDANAHTWNRDRHFIEREVVLWPASWLKGRGLVMPVEEYRRLLVEKITDVRRNCAQARFDYFPAYLAACVKDHFRHNEDAIYEKAKAARGPISAVLAKLPAASAGKVDAVEPLAMAHAVLAARRGKKARSTAPKGKQEELW